MIWVPVTVAAATFQILRTSTQHRLRRQLGVNGASYTRFLYGFPLALVALSITAVVAGIPTPSGRFWLWIVAAGISQILATMALLASFRQRDFATGTVFAKTEVVQVALLSALLLGEVPSVVAWLGIVTCVVGVVWLAAPDGWRTVAAQPFDSAVWLGLAAGGGFAVAAAGIRAAALSLPSGSTWQRAVLVLAVLLGVQTLINGLYLAVADRAELGRVFGAWRTAAVVGALSFGGSAAWAVALTLTSAARVRTLGQVELVIAFAVSVLVLRERHRAVEYVASALVMLGVVMVVVG